ncbi:[4Fe-4S] proteins maturation [Cladophialophora chaetospira]|uniref:[4Fe-4S] proteins maturation n=1 Tax=Cladophialophora chaetospira TaxID=386627 RepID=A0AA38X6J3_9EURO|nr:[4Fe-4S] proteins maturation [Cladophialophora chaetospira]
MSQSPLRLAFSKARPLRASHDPPTYLRVCRARLSTNSIQPNPLRRTASQSNAAFRSPRSQFSSTTSKRAIVILQNPRTDDDGKDMTIDISERAAKRLRQITSSPPQKNTLTPKSAASPDSHLRVTVTSGGCHGFQYLMSLEEASKIDQEEDTIFEYNSSEGESDSSVGKAEVVMDSASLELLKGSTIDFTQELIGSQFKIVGNPRATSSCGCGTSFDIE